MSNDMIEMMHIRKANIADIEHLLQLFAQARRVQVNQWKDDDPSTDVLKRDIDCDSGRIIEIGGRPAGYVAISYRDEEYDKFPQLWSATDKYKYAALHRIAISDEFRGRGLSHWIFNEAEQEAKRMGALYIRIDTGLENAPMHHILSRRNYANLGACEFVWGKRVAYEKKL